jgi:hypothetical protein
MYYSEIPLSHSIVTPNNYNNNYLYSSSIRQPYFNDIRESYVPLQYSRYQNQYQLVGELIQPKYHHKNPANHDVAPGIV